MPYQITNGQVADAAPVMTNFSSVVNCLNNFPGGAVNAIQLNSGSGGLSGVGPLTDGQLIIGVTNGVPQAATLAPGQGIAITNTPGSVTITATSAGAGAWPPLQPPTTAMFSADKGVSGITLFQADDPNIGYLNYVDMMTLSGGNRYDAKVSAITNQGDWHAVWRMTFSALDFNYWTAGLILYKEGAQNVTFVCYNYSSGVKYDVLRYNQSTGAFIDTSFAGSGTNVGQGNFFKVAYAKATDTISFYFSKNGKIWQKTGSVIATSFMGGPPDRIGFGNAPNFNGGDFGNIGFSVDYWDSDAF